MRDPKLKHLANQVLNELAKQTTDTTQQIGLIRELAEVLNTEAACLEVVAAGKRVSHG